MFTQAEYINGWLAYAGAVIVCYWCWWYMLSKLPIKPLRPVLLGAMAGLLFMPWSVDPAMSYLAPAWLIAGSDGLFEGAAKFWRAGAPLLVAVVASIIVALIIQIMSAFLSPVANTKPVPTKKTKTQYVKREPTLKRYAR
jgi:NADH:ubiquinone oxidoreductase subunit 6 (subunit J)